jgi:hypothetical protein
MRDYVTVPFVIVGMVIGFRGSLLDKALAWGSLLYLAFVVGHPRVSLTAFDTTRGGRDGRVRCDGAGDDQCNRPERARIFGFDHRRQRHHRRACLHLPAERTRQWRIGHFLRQLPTNYEASVAQRANLLTDPRTHAYYESIRDVTRGRLNSLDRLREVARLTLGPGRGPGLAYVLRNKSAALIRCRSGHVWFD